MGSRPSVFRAPAVAELSRISVFGCAGAGAGVGAADLSDAFGVVERLMKPQKMVKMPYQAWQCWRSPVEAFHWTWLPGNWLPAWGKTQPREAQLEPSLDQCWRWACLPE